MKNYQLTIEGLEEMQESEQGRISGGIGLALLAALGGLYTAYSLGKVVGTELRHMMTN